jgi:hypothetical protein
MDSMERAALLETGQSQTLVEEPAELQQTNRIQNADP